MVIATAFWSQWTLLTGIIGIVAIALLMGHSLARAGLDAMLVKLSQFNRFKAIMLIGLTILFQGVLFVFAIPITITIFDGASIEFVRLTSLMAAIAFLPFFAYILASLILKET